MKNVIEMVRCHLCSKVHPLKISSGGIFYLHCIDENVIFVNFNRGENADRSREESQ